MPPPIPIDVTARPARKEVSIPSSLTNTWSDTGSWLGDLPVIVRTCADRWQLELEEPIDAPHSLVVPAGDVVLKLNAPSHVEAEHEADALAAWAGHGAVRLVDRDDELRALLLERCRPGICLWDTEVDQHAAVVSVLERLPHTAPDGHPFRHLADEADGWLADVTRRHEQNPCVLERALFEIAVDTFEQVDRTASQLVNQDLHGGNVLSSARDEWLAIDPKPLVGERELDAVGLLRNAAWRDGGAGVRGWLDALQELGLERERMRCWGVAHTIAWADNGVGGWSETSIDAARTIASA